jgi:hypothetical protein
MYGVDYEILLRQWSFSHQSPTIFEAPEIHLHQACPSPIEGNKKCTKSKNKWANKEVNVPTHQL